MQLSRFLFIQNAVEDVFENDTDTRTRYLINRRLKVLEANWTKFQVEYDIICHEATKQLEEQSYIKNKVYKRCQKFYVQARTTLLVCQEEIEGTNPSSKSSNLSTSPLQVTCHRRTLPRIDLPKFLGNYDMEVFLRFVFVHGC